MRQRQNPCPRMKKQTILSTLLFAFGGLCVYLTTPDRDTRALDIQLDTEDNVFLELTRQSIVKDTMDYDMFNRVQRRHNKPKTKESRSGKSYKIENMDRNESVCHISFPYGEMCPTLYTDLGGYCQRDLSTPDGFDCPDIRRKGRNALRSTQLVLTRMLKIFDLVAKKHRIKYWITSGTLLGAARHRGFIPWDVDADVQMPFSEYVKLFKCCRDEFPEGTFFQNSVTDPYLRPGNETEYRILRDPVVGLYRMNWNPRIRDRKSCTRYCLTYEDCKWEDGLMMDIFIAEDSLPSYQRARVFPLKKMLFEGFYLPVPNNWKDILSSLYGNYNSEIGEGMNREPEDDADPFHSCEELKKLI